MKLPIQHALLKHVAGLPSQLDKINRQSQDEIAIVGRSNVGKSSLINHLFQNKSLAKVSGVPGKTETINFFDVDRACYLVDLPGYGFARKSKQEQEKWEDLIIHYFQSSRPIRSCLVLIDARRVPMEERDLQLLSWLETLGIPFHVIATKADKFPKTKLQKQKRLLQKALDEALRNPREILFYSIYEKQSRDALIKQIENLLC